jgi:hypothetical protein
MKPTSGVAHLYRPRLELCFAWHRRPQHQHHRRLFFDLEARDLRHLSVCQKPICTGICANSISATLTRSRSVLMTWRGPISPGREPRASGSAIKQLVANGERTKPKRKRIWRRRMSKKQKNTKPNDKPMPLTDAERHKRFVNMAHEVEASDDPKDFDEAFNKVLKRPSTSK